MDKLGTLATAVRDARKQRRWKQQELAERAGVSLGVVSNLERQLTRPQPANERAILAALDIVPEDDLPPVDPDRREWPPDVQVVLDVVGLYLSAQPEKERADIIHDLTRWVMGNQSKR